MDSSAFYPIKREYPDACLELHRTVQFRCTDGIYFVNQDKKYALNIKRYYSNPPSHVKYLLHKFEFLALFTIA